MIFALVASAWAAEEEPQRVAIEVTTVEGITPSLSGVSFTVVTSITRNAGYPWTLTGLTYDLQVNGASVGQARSEIEPTRMKKGDPVLVKMPGSVDGMLAAQALAGALMTGTAQVQVNGTIEYRFLFFHRVAPFQTPIYP